MRKFHLDDASAIGTLLTRDELKSVFGGNGSSGSQETHFGKCNEVCLNKKRGDRCRCEYNGVKYDNSRRHCDYVPFGYVKLVCTEFYS